MDCRLNFNCCTWKASALQAYASPPHQNCLRGDKSVAIVVSSIIASAASIEAKGCPRKAKLNVTFVLRSASRLKFTTHIPNYRNFHLPKRPSEGRATSICSVSKNLTRQEDGLQNTNGIMLGPLCIPRSLLEQHVFAGKESWQQKKEPKKKGKQIRASFGHDC